MCQNFLQVRDKLGILKQYQRILVNCNVKIAVKMSIANFVLMEFQVIC